MGEKDPMNPEINLTPDEIIALAAGNRIVDPFLRLYGQLFNSQPLPSRYRAGKFGSCFSNSYSMALRHGVTYVEGYAVSTNTNFAHSHAWCVDDEGNVLDRTWRSAKAYFGIPFQLSYLRRVIKDRKQRLGKDYYFGLLDDWEAGHPLIKLHGDTPELWLAMPQPPEKRRSSNLKVCPAIRVTGEQHLAFPKSS